MARTIRPAGPLIAALYPRVSSAAQAESKDKARPQNTAEDDKQQETSLETQERACREYAAANGYLIDEGHIYREVYTGVELWERPQLTRLREAVRHREVGAVVAYAIDRLARDPVHLGVILSEAEHAGVPVHFVTEPLDNSPEGQLIRFVRGYAAKVEHEKIKERTIRGHRARVHAGKPWGARAPYGYRWADDDRAGLVLDPPAAAVVRRIFRDALAGVSLRALACALTAEGIPAPSGQASWWMSTLRGILHNPVYTGQMVALRWRTVRSASGRMNRQERRPAEEQVVLPVACEALVTEAEFAAVQERLTRNKALAGRHNGDPTATLLRGGYVRCGACGRTMTAHFKRTGYSRERKWYYECNNSAPVRCPRPTINATALDAAVWQAARQFLQQPTLIRQQLEALQQADPAAADLAAVDTALTDVERKQRKGAQALLVLDEEAARPVMVELGALAQQARQLHAERDRLRAQQGAWQATQTRLDDLAAWCQNVAANLDALDHAERRLAVEALDLCVQVYPPKRPRQPEPRWQITAAVPLSSPHIVNAGS
jgi:site-specific DNA recombinase